MTNLWHEEMADDTLDCINMSFLLSSSDEEHDTTPHGGSAPGKAVNIVRGRNEAVKRLFNDYISVTSVYNSVQFARRYRISKSLFLDIVNALEVYDPYFTQRKDCTGKFGFTSLQKATAALRLLAYGSAADSVDEYVQMGESTALFCLEHFCEGVVGCFGETYSTAPKSIQ